MKYTCYEVQTRARTSKDWCVEMASTKREAIKYARSVLEWIASDGSCYSGVRIVRVTTSMDIIPKKEWS